MYKAILFALVALCGVLSSVRADDEADARKAFDTFVLYAKTHDKRLIDLFAPDVSASLTLDTGKEKMDQVMSADEFREFVKQGVNEKEDGKDTYENVKCEQDGNLVKLTCTCLDAESGRRVPLVLIYKKDDSAHLQISVIKITAPVDRLPLPAGG